MYKLAYENHVEYEVMEFSTFPASLSPLTIFFISDIHKREISLSIIEEVKDVADIVIIGGDLLDKRVSLAQVKKNLQLLKQVGQVFFVWGNNDYEIDIQKLKNLFEAEDVTAIKNDAFILKTKVGEKLGLLAIDDLSTENDCLDDALQAANGCDFKLLISHNPKIIKKIKEEDKIDLVLSGHTHGGQIRLFGFGLYEKGCTKIMNGTTMLVSNGYGTSSFSLRLGARAQTHLIRINHKV